MQQSSSVTPKGQVTIPSDIRERWNLKPKEKVVFLDYGNRVEIRPAVDFLQLRGSIKSKKLYSDSAADEAAKAFIHQDYDGEKDS